MPRSVGDEYSSSSIPYWEGDSVKVKILLRSVRMRLEQSIPVTVVIP